MLIDEALAGWGYVLLPLAAPHHRRDGLVFGRPSTNGQAKSGPSPGGGRGNHSLSYEHKPPLEPLGTKALVGGCELSAQLRSAVRRAAITRRPMKRGLWRSQLPHRPETAEAGVSRRRALACRPTQGRRSRQPTRSLARERGHGVVARLSPLHRAGLAGRCMRTRGKASAMQAKCPVRVPFRTQHPLGAWSTGPRCGLTDGFPRRVGLYTECRLTGG
jgi:hypothetical protein